VLVAQEVGYVSGSSYQSLEGEKKKLKRSHASTLKRKNGCQPHGKVTTGKEGYRWLKAKVRDFQCPVRTPGRNQRVMDSQN